MSERNEKTPHHKLLRRAIDQEEPSPYSLAEMAELGNDPTITHHCFSDLGPITVQEYQRRGLQQDALKTRPQQLYTKTEVEAFKNGKTAGRKEVTVPVGSERGLVVKIEQKYYELTEKKKPMKAFEVSAPPVVLGSRLSVSRAFLYLLRLASNEAARFQCLCSQSCHSPNGILWKNSLDVPQKAPHQQCHRAWTTIFRSCLHTEPPRAPRFVRCFIHTYETSQPVQEFQQRRGASNWRKE